MGKKVTYGIEYAKKPNIAKIVKEHIAKYQTLLSENRSTKAAETVINITEWVLDVSDEVDDPKDEEILQYLAYVIKHSKNAVKLLEPEEHFGLLSRAHNNMCQCYLKLHIYSSAIQHGLITINLFNQHPTSQTKSHLQNAYKIIGDIYFTKSLNKLESRYSDFENAHKYYLLEKQVIDTMDLSDIEEAEPDDLKKLKQSSHFNLGVMESKVHALYTDAEKNLQEAVTLAHKLNDSVAERTVWWELANLYKRAEKDNNVKFCQREEFNLAKRCGFKEDMFYCFEEKCKFLLYLEEYDEYFQFYEQNIGSIGPTYIKQCVK
ncbi:hypothetical protein HPULCUR_004000 [Helicostylum pulchrum]|uniref:Uncharacterized protein n=1 Tax=Helicostylum pulchrum TaxID=562976 RepID=A0ABP9XW55_9FUNG